MAPIDSSAKGTKVVIAYLDKKRERGLVDEFKPNADGFTMEQVAPMRPLAYESDAQDWIVTFKFELILLSPDEARSTILDEEAETEESEPSAAIRADQEDEA